PLGVPGWAAGPVYQGRTDEPAPIVDRRTTEPIPVTPSRPPAHAAPDDDYSELDRLLDALDAPAAGTAAPAVQDRLPARTPAPALPPTMAPPPRRKGEPKLGRRKPKV